MINTLIIIFNLSFLFLNFLSQLMDYHSLSSQTRYLDIVLHFSTFYTRNIKLITLPFYPNQIFLNYNLFFLSLNRDKFWNGFLSSFLCFQFCPISSSTQTIFKVIYLKHIFDNFYFWSLLSSMAFRCTQNNIIHVNMAKKAFHDQALIKLKSPCPIHNHGNKLLANLVNTLLPLHSLLIFPVKNCPLFACIVRNHLSLRLSSSATLSTSISKSS